MKLDKKKKKKCEFERIFKYCQKAYFQPFAGAVKEPNKAASLENGQLSSEELSLSKGSLPKKEACLRTGPLPRKEASLRTVRFPKKNQV
jgi:hypothetical protein